MLYIPDELVASARRMSEFEDLLTRFKRQREQAQAIVQRFNQVIDLLERAKEALGPEGLEQLINSLPRLPNVVAKEPQRTRGIFPPADVAATVKLVLSETGRPMKRGELVAELEKRQILLAGKDKNKNLGTILWRHPTEFIHLEKLGYWLRAVPLEGVYKPEN
jgi:hypothetical protein